MKKLAYILLMAAALPFASCKKEMMGYEGMEGVYFGVRYGSNLSIGEASYPYRAATNIEFVKQPDGVNELQASIRVAITGPVKDYDRPFRVEVVADSTTAQAGVHYLPIAGEYIIPARSIEGFIPITLKRTPDMLTEDKRVVLRLLANEHFGLAFPEWKAPVDLGFTQGADTAFNASLHTINVNDLMVEPEVWYGSIAADRREAGAWGAFTRKKLLLMCELFDLKYEDFSSETTMTLVLTNLITAELKRYLINQSNAGTPVLEEDGRMMWCDGVPWTSYVP